MKKFILMGMVVLLMFGLIGCGNIVNVKGQKLTEYSYSHGGGMLGGYGAVEVATVNGEVYLIYHGTETYAGDEVVSEYAVDAAILDELEAVFRRYKMNRWNQKKFTNAFVADGESYSYVFSFDGGARVSFSSQIYPQNYRNKLNEFSAIIDRYKETATLLPGLVVEEKSSEELMQINHPDNGRVELEVYEYCKGRLYYRVMNGTGETINLPYKVQVVRNSDGTVVYDKGSDGSTEVSANYTYEKSFLVEERLGEGTYTITIGEYDSVFEISF